MIDQYRVHIIQYRKTEAGWLLTENESIDSVLTLFSVNMEIPLREIYDLVEFELINPSGPL
ncbi:MAG: hypothetical protein ACRCT1_11260 [Microcoleaceae cyanobacterium]